MAAQSTESIRVRLLRVAFHHFYNTFAWTYDAVSAAISLGHWREWTGAAIPHLRGGRILEIAFGTGNMQLDMRAAGFTPYGMDVSRNMVRLTAHKLIRAAYRPRLARASVLALPFADESFDSLVLTFPPNFLGSPRAVSEMRRVLAVGGRLVMVDNGHLHKPQFLSGLVNLAFRFTGTAGARANPAEPLQAAGFDVRMRWEGDSRSGTSVLIADKVDRPEQPTVKLHIGGDDAN
jgi:ubiquinone/menaquinone biosynthesis C-methylase UbiE